MTIVSVHRVCDVCGKDITREQEFIKFLTHLGILFGEYMHCHTGKCEEALDASQEAQDWKLLPPGTLRTFFEQYTQTGGR